MGREFAGLDGLSFAMAVAAVLVLPIGIVDAGDALLNPAVLGIGVAIALLSSTIPYAFELIALRRIAPAVFAILMSTGPATATLAGFLLLGQALSLLQLAGVGLVIAASIGAVATSGTPRARPTDDEPDEPLAEPLA